MSRVWREPGKVVQIACGVNVAADGSYSHVLYALTEDGGIWSREDPYADWDELYLPNDQEAKT